MTEAIGRRFPDRCAGIHLNLVLLFSRPPADEELTETERRALADLDEFQRTAARAPRPSSPPAPNQTLGYGLADSPAAQCAWIIEKPRAWSDCDGHPENVLTRDELLDNVMLYWLPATGASSARLYWESFSARAQPGDPPRAGISVFPREIVRPARRWVEPRSSATSCATGGEPAQGGHFAAFEQPDLFVTEVRNFFRLVR